MAFLALGSREDLSVGPCVGGCLGDNFLFAIDFLREDRVGSESKFYWSCALTDCWGMRKALFARVVPRVFNRRALW